MGYLRDNFKDKHLDLETRYLALYVQELYRRIMSNDRQGTWDINPEDKSLGIDLAQEGLGSPVDQELCQYGEENYEGTELDSTVVHLLNSEPECPYELDYDYDTQFVRVHRRRSRREFLVHNSYHGDIVCELVRETPTAYFFDYVQDGEVIFRDWRVLKRSNRVLKEVFPED